MNHMYDLIKIKKPNMTNTLKAMDPNKSMTKNL